MGLLEDARAAQLEKARRVFPCAVVVVLSGLSGDDATDFQSALDDTTIDSVTLASVMRARGHMLSQKQIQNHRGGRCPCGR